MIDHFHAVADVLTRDVRPLIANSSGNNKPLQESEINHNQVVGDNDE